MVATRTARTRGGGGLGAFPGPVEGGEVGGGVAVVPEPEPPPQAAAAKLPEKEPEKEPGLWALSFTIVDLVPQKGEDGKIGPPKGPSPRRTSRSGW